MTYEETIQFARRDDEGVDNEEEVESGSGGYEPTDPFGDGDAEESGS